MGNWQKRVEAAEEALGRRNPRRTLFWANLPLYLLGLICVGVFLGPAAGAKLDRFADRWLTPDIPWTPVLVVAGVAVLLVVLLRWWLRPSPGRRYR